MIRIALPDADAGHLGRIFHDTDEVRLRHPTQIVLMAHRGRPHGDIARDTGTRTRSVQRWLNAYLIGGLDALRPRKANGARPKLTDDLAPILKRWVIDGPVKQGLDRANRTYAELADHLSKHRGIRARKSALRAFRHRHEIRPYRPTYRFLRGDPEKRAIARTELAELKKGRKTVGSSC